MHRTTILLGALLLGATSTTASAGDVCIKSAKLQKKATAAELEDDYNIALAICANLDDDDAHDECLADAKDEYKEGRELAKQQFQARLELCAKLGGGSYDPVIDPDAFTSEIDHPYFPLPVGANWIYELDGDEGFEVVDVEVLDETREILGVACRAVRDTVTVDGEFVEDTIDWFAQDADGNVWYFGEVSFGYEDGYVSSLEGSWLAGVDGAKPGIVMLAAPSVGTTYRQEWLPGDAEDAATVLATDASITIGAGTYTGCVLTEDFTPVEPDALENKFYAAGIGFVAEIGSDGELLELVSATGL